MATELQATLERIMSKCTVLLENYEVLKTLNSELQTSLEKAESELQSLRAENERMAIDLKFMKIAKNVAPTASEAKAASEMLSKMVRDIDKCISQLNE